ncbi:hypothetical protein NIES25_63140 (plasmid) [Nostoc linckia NIES-25]|nr:hypothetical protein NIES25_63140 [Nostoc linckia NIES-25]
MFYREFSLIKVKQDFNLTLVEGGRFLPPIEPISPSRLLAEFLADLEDDADGDSHTPNCRLHQANIRINCYAIEFFHINYLRFVCS